MIKDVFDIGFEVLKRIQETQSEAMDAAGQYLAQAFLNDNSCFVTGSGHSHTVTEEFYARAGGLAFVKPILTSELTITEHPTKSSYIERLPGYAGILTELYRISENDVVIIASNSGRNAYPIEMALESKKKGATVIAITSVQHSSSVTSRHASGKKLMDIADVVIDNCGVPGDCALKLDGLEALICPTSSMANSFIVQSICVQCADYIVKAGKTPPVFVSLNSMDTEHMNDNYFSKYTRMY